MKNKHKTKKRIITLFTCLMFLASIVIFVVGCDGCGRDNLSVPSNFVINESFGTISWQRDENCDFTTVSIRRAGESDFVFINDMATDYVSIADLDLTIGENTLRVISKKYPGTERNANIQSAPGDFTINITTTTTQSLAHPASFVNIDGAITWSQNPLANGFRVYFRQAGSEQTTLIEESGPNYILREQLNLLNGINVLSVRALGGVQTIIGTTLRIQTDSPLASHNIEEGVLPTQQLARPTLVIEDDMVIVSNRASLCQGVVLSFAEGNSNNWTELFRGDIVAPLCLVEDLNITAPVGRIRAMSLGGIETYIEGILTLVTNSSYVFYNVDIPRHILSNPRDFSTGTINVIWDADSLCENTEIYIKRAGDVDFYYVTTLSGVSSIRVDSLDLTIGENILRVISRGTGFVRDDLDMFFYIEDSEAINHTITVLDKQTMPVPSPTEFEFNARGYEINWTEYRYALQPTIYIRLAGEETEFELSCQNFRGEFYITYADFEVGVNTIRVISGGGQTIFRDGYLITFTDSLPVDFDVIITEVIENRITPPFNFAANSLNTGLIWSYSPEAEESVVYIERNGEFERFMVYDQGEYINPPNFIPFSLLNLSTGINRIRIASAGGQHTFNTVEYTEFSATGTLTKATDSEFVYLIIEVNDAGIVVDIREE
ncbi:MAG: hypothetical protein FWE13_03225 [Firmicutes bacterium]|nr:hypothetical protein [Bacillota bacterium]